MTVHRESWLRSLLAAAFPNPAPRPVYGSPEWLQLPERSLQRLASAAVAGECWARDGETLPQRLEDELRARREWEDAEDARVGAWAASIANQPPYVELARRRGVPLGKGQRYMGWLRWRDDELRRTW